MPWRHTEAADALLHSIVTLPYRYDIEAKQNSQMYGRDTAHPEHL